MHMIHKCLPISHAVYISNALFNKDTVFKNHGLMSSPKSRVGELALEHDVLKGNG